GTKPAAPRGDGVEAAVTAAGPGMRSEPRRSSPPHAPDLLGVDHLQRISVAVAGLALHFAERERASAPHDEVQLVAADPDVRAEDAVAAQAVVPTSPLLARVPHSTVRARSG